MKHALLLALALGLPLSAIAQEDKFFAGKQITLLVGFGAGGGYDLYGRTVIAHMGRHIPGNPAMVASNMPGAGGLELMNNLANLAPRDGTLIATFASGLPTAPLFNPEQARFDPTRLGWIGAVNTEEFIDIAWHTAPVQSLADLKSRELIVAGASPGDAGVDLPRLVNGVLGLKYRIVTGYKAMNEMELAMERGEAEGISGTTWTSLRARHADWLERRLVTVIAQYGETAHPELPNVPLMRALARSEAETEALDLLFSRQEMGRPFAAPPGLPPARLAILRRAFDATMKDPLFLADATKRQFELDPKRGEEVEKIVARIMATPPDVVARVKSILSQPAK
jgi:tripartite-type tricarboxylate transporter receptor subunit TctC